MNSIYAGCAIGLEYNTAEMLTSMFEFVESFTFFLLFPSEQVMKRMITKMKAATATQIVPAIILSLFFYLFKTFDNFFIKNIFLEGKLLSTAYFCYEPFCILSKCR